MMNAEQEQKPLISKTQEFVRRQFQENPHFSFNDWTVMYDHSIKTMEFAKVIAEGIPEVDQDVIEIGALLHDIGKTYQADDETLHTEHQSFNFPISEKFLGELNLPEEQLQKLKDVISYKSDSIEMQVVKDADAIALYADKRLYMLFIEWAVKNKLDWAIKRKIEKFNLLYFNKSREIGKPLLEVMERDWDKYQGQHR